MDVSFSSPSELEVALDNLSSSAKSAISLIAVGATEDERVVTISDEYAAELEAADTTTRHPQARDVTAERDRRLSLDFTFNGVQFQRDIDAVRRINGAGTLALAAIVGGAQPGDLRWHGGDSDFVWIAADNSLVPMDAQTVMAFGAAAAHRETELVFTAKAIKAMDPIPSDFTDDAYWP